MSEQLNLRALDQNIVSQLKYNDEAKEYNGCSYLFLGNSIIQRTAKITPTKIGQFVTLWKRNREGITCPLSDKDSVDFLIILCFKDEIVGRFLFPKSILIEKGYLSSSEKNGKRGFRVYPDWDVPTSKQALKTQGWQTRFFKRSDIISTAELSL